MLPVTHPGCRCAHLFEYRIPEDAFSEWDTLNPPGFVYGESAADPDYFVNDYCVISAWEDRAMICEAAIRYPSEWWESHPRILAKLQMMESVLQTYVPDMQLMP